MSDFDFELNTDSAATADRAANSIESAAYVGEFTAAYLRVSENTGAKALELRFKADEGGNARYTIWFKSGTAKGGKIIDGNMATINAIMAVLGVRELKGQEGDIVKFDGTTERGITYPGLLGKKIGIVNQNILKDKDGGGTRTDRELVLPYDPRTQRTASELVANETTPKKLAKVLKNLKDKDERKIRNTGVAGSLFSDVAEDSGLDL